MGLNRNKIFGEPLPPKPTSEGFAQIVEAVRKAETGDEALAYISLILELHGYTAEGLKCLRFPPIFDVPRETLLPKATIKPTGD